MEKTDLDLVLAFKLGEKEAFIKLYDKYIDKIYKFIYYKTSHRETAEDLSSQTFLKAFKNLSDFRVQSGDFFSAWLYRIARNLVTDFYRSKKDLLEIFDIWDLTDDTDILRDIEFKEKSASLEKYLKKLNNEQREIIILKIFQEMSYKEISEIMGKSEEACKMSFSRTLKKLKTEMPISLLIYLFLFKI